MNTEPTLILLGAPLDNGAGEPGCAQGPAALRAAGIVAALGGTRSVIDRGDIRPGHSAPLGCSNPAVHSLPAVAAWAGAIAAATAAAAAHGVPFLMGGDHAIAAGSIAGMAARARELGRPLFVLWIDAHPDFHTLTTTTSGNLHGVPMAYATGLPGFIGFPQLVAPVQASNVGMIGIRSVDQAERQAMRSAGIAFEGTFDLDAFLARVVAADGLLHVSFDADALDPADAPGVGSPVPGGLRLPDAMRIMATLHASRRVSSVDFVELNPRLDTDGRTARALVMLAAALASGVGAQAFSLAQAPTNAHAA